MGFHNAESDCVFDIPASVGTDRVSGIEPAAIGTDGNPWTISSVHFKIQPASNSGDWLIRGVAYRQSSSPTISSYTKLYPTATLFDQSGSSTKVKSAVGIPTPDPNSWEIEVAVPGGNTVRLLFLRDDTGGYDCEQLRVRTVTGHDIAVKMQCDIVVTSYGNAGVSLTPCQVGSPGTDGINGVDGADGSAGAAGSVGGDGPDGNPGYDDIYVGIFDSLVNAETVSDAIYDSNIHASQEYFTADAVSAAKATAQITTSVAANFEDGDAITIEDYSGASETFVINQSGSFVNDFTLEVDISSAVSDSDVAGILAVAINSSVLNVSISTISEIINLTQGGTGEDGNVTITYTGDGFASVSGFSGGDELTEAIAVITPDLAAAFATEDQIAITDVDGVTGTFVFDTDDTYSAPAGQTEIDISGDTTAAEVAATIETAIDDSDLSFDSIVRSDEVITLTQDTNGPDGNNPITTTSSLGFELITGFSGGALAEDAAYVALIVGNSPTAGGNGASGGNGANGEDGENGTDGTDGGVGGAGQPGGKGGRGGRGGRGGPGGPGGAGGRGGRGGTKWAIPHTVDDFNATLARAGSYPFPAAELESAANGSDGSDGSAGSAGANGTNGADGADGPDGPALPSGCVMP